MTIREHTFRKEERLSWKRYIDLLFEKGQSFIAYPLRVVFLPIEKQQSTHASVLISVSKKKFKRAVKRNRVKRLIRETYRLQKQPLISSLEEKECHLLIAFLFLDDKLPTFPEMEKAMTKAISSLQKKTI